MLIAIIRSRDDFSSLFTPWSPFYLSHTRSHFSIDPKPTQMKPFCDSSEMKRLWLDVEASAFFSCLLPERALVHFTRSIEYKKTWSIYFCRFRFVCCCCYIRDFCKRHTQKLCVNESNNSSSEPSTATYRMKVLRLIRLMPIKDSDCDRSSTKFLWMTCYK